ncbi:MAG: nickel-responsive transcriptional regulator NikR [bacterium]
MTNLKRFSISLNKDLVNKFDNHIKEKNYSTRSKAIGDLIRQDFVKTEWIQGEKVIGIITMVYDHHKKELVNKLIDIEHHFHDLIISSQHIHLDKDNCVEIIITKSNPKKIENLFDKLKSTKGVKHSSLSMATTGQQI